MDSKVIQGSADKCGFRYHQSNVRRLLPDPDYCRGRDNKIVEPSSDNETVFGSTRKLGGAAKHLIEISSEKCICQLTFEL